MSRLGIEPRTRRLRVNPYLSASVYPVHFPQEVSSLLSTSVRRVTSFPSRCVSNVCVNTWLIRPFWFRAGPLQTAALVVGQVQFVLSQLVAQLVVFRLAERAVR